MFTIQHCAPVLEDIEETDHVSTLTAYVNEALESSDPYASSLRRDCGSRLTIIRRMPKSVCLRARAVFSVNGGITSGLESIE